MRTKWAVRWTEQLNNEKNIVFHFCHSISIQSEEKEGTKKYAKSIKMIRKNKMTNRSPY